MSYDGMMYDQLLWETTDHGVIVERLIDYITHVGLKLALFSLILYSVENGASLKRNRTEVLLLTSLASYRLR